MVKKCRLGQESGITVHCLPIADPARPSYDKLYELKVDDDGTLVQPVIRTAKWKMRSVTPHRGDNGRIELFEIGLEKKSV